jgi:succinoglycan biosynthesis protein ExoA
MTLTSLPRESESVRMSHATLVMPVFNEIENLGDVLASIDAQDVDADRLFFVIVDSDSNDGSREFAIRWLAGSAINGIVISNPRRSIPTSLNLGIGHARPGDIVIRLDAHTTYAPDYVSSILDAFAAAPATVACVGGCQIPHPEAGFQRALVTALYTNPLGLGGAGFRRTTAARPASNVYLGAWRPGVLEAAGGFDERWKANEDAELAARIRQLGYQTLQIPAISAYRVNRGPFAVIRQWGKYGYWRAQTLRRHPKELRLRHLVPPIALVVAAALLFTPLRWIVAALFVSYALGIWQKRARPEPALVTLASCAFFPACQIAWGVGLFSGLLAPNARSRAASTRAA